MAHGFPIPLFTLILWVSILEPSEPSGSSAFVFASNLDSLESIILSYIILPPPSPITPYFPDSRFSRCLKYTLRDVSIATVHGFSGSLFVNLIFVCIWQFFATFYVTFSVTESVILSCVIFLKPSPVPPSYCPIKIAIRVFSCIIETHFSAGWSICGARAVVYTKIINKKALLWTHFRGLGCRAQTKMNQKLIFNAVVEVI